MRRVLIVLPELLGEPSVLREKLPTLATLAEMGTLYKLSPLPHVETPEALFLGLRPDEGQLRQGPLTVAALGADPPDRSTHFHVSAMTFDGTMAALPTFRINAEEEAILAAAAKKLDTKTLTFLVGDQLDHGLVWEGLGDLGTTAAHHLDGKNIREMLPQGDAEPMLRRFIDDSVNLLSELEMNERRRGEDLPPINLLWPWGHGLRLPVPNLALKRGDPALVISEDRRLQGLTRLAGYRHTGLRDFGSGLGTMLEKLADRMVAETTSFWVSKSFAHLRAGEKLEEAAWLIRQIDERLLKRVFAQALVEPTRIALAAPAAGGGLAVLFETKMASSNILPFDERSLEEKKLPGLDLWEFIQSAAL